MKKIISLLLAVMLIVSAVPMAYAADTQDYSLGTTVKYTAENNEDYTITVPAKLAPGQGGTVTLDGYWASNTVVTVTAEENVVLTNSINANDKKTLEVSFDGISEAGNNSAKQTFTAPVSVAGISNALFGTWSGHFNYTVGTSEGSGGSTGGDSGTTEPSNPGGGSDELNPDDGSTPVEGDVYTAGDYMYTYSTNGWKVALNTDVTDKNQTSYGAILESINGEPVTSMYETFMYCRNLTEAPVIPESVTNLYFAFDNCNALTTAPIIPDSVTNMVSTFAACRALTGVIEINANPVEYNWCFAGDDFATQNLTLTGSSTVLDEIGATGTNYCADCNGKCQGHEEANLITFTIDGTEYQAEETMHWGEWIESEYNTDGYVADDEGLIRHADGRKVKYMHYDISTSTYITAAAEREYTLEEAEATLITFTIGSYKYQAEEGMTWGEWVESNYNPGDYEQTTGRIISGDYSVWNGETEVSTADVIDANVTYVLSDPT